MKPIFAQLAWITRRRGRESGRRGRESGSRGRESGHGGREYDILRSMGEQIKYYRRYHGYDYSRGASLFITMATEPRKALFGKVENGFVVLSSLGRLVLEAITRYIIRARRLPGIERRNRRHGNGWRGRGALLARRRTA